MIGNRRGHAGFPQVKFKGGNVRINLPKMSLSSTVVKKGKLKGRRRKTWYEIEKNKRKDYPMSMH